ncbi:MAG: DUF6364 family protein [Actinocatenispora sp.]
MAFTLRLDSELTERAKQRAQREHRSLTGIVEHALVQYLDNTASDDEVAALLPGIAVQVRDAGEAHEGRRTA